MLGVDPVGLIFLSGAAFVAGLVRGFAGFGTAMIYLPVAGQILSPFAALTTLVFMDVIAPLPNAPRAWRDGNPGTVARLGIAFVLALPLGLYALTQVPVEVFRYTVSAIAIGLLICLIFGFRYRGELTRPVIFGTGALSGFTAGAAGLPGPPVILLYMAGPHAAAVVRANTLMFLIMADLILIPMLAVFGRLEMNAILVGLLLIVPATAGNVAGAFLFRPGQEAKYRTVAYIVIAASALSGLPMWD